MKDIILSEAELAVLTALAKNDKAIDLFVKQRKFSNDRNCSAEEGKFEELRTALTEWLGKIGFDENYCPTKEGRILEELIDKLFTS
jgi:hypothetical protein